MPRIREEEVYNIFLKKIKGDVLAKIKDVDVCVKFRPEDVHTYDSPDIILWLEVDFKIFGENFNVKVPIPIEVEEIGIKGAQEDLDKFIDREKYNIELPMIVVGGHSFDYKLVDRKDGEKLKLPVSFKVREIPERILRLPR